MYRHLERLLAQRVRECLQRRHPDAPLPKVVLEQPPNVEMGDFALPVFPFAKPLRTAPLKIAEEIRGEIGSIEGVAGMKVAGPGYLNIFLDRAAMAAALIDDETPAAEVPSGKILVEHSSINPNKAAHVGHLRNAILGDTFVRLLRFQGREVDVQNYIDNTGVQVADVVVGFLHLEKNSFDEIEELSRQPRFDYYCWDIYARASHWYEVEKENLKARSETLHAIEKGGNETAAAAELISTAVLRRHLETMERLGIEYDFLPRESEILHLHFWDAAFELMKQKAVLVYIREGKNKGCWVMRRGGKPSITVDAENTEGIPEDDQKVIVRSNGTVGYVGKDIAYHLWKFGLLGKDFGYKEFYLYPDDRECWISTIDGEPEHPHFGGVSEIYNVIDARQAEAQNAVIEALRALGFEDQADHYTHFSYEMVALTPRCASELGYQLSDEDKARPYIEVSGRKGFGVKADDLIDRLIDSAKKEVDTRHPELSEDDRSSIARQIAIGALRYFMLKFTKQSVIAFDFEEALSFEGETGPYAQYAVVRATNIFRKGGFDPEHFQQHAAKIRKDQLAEYLNGETGNEIWQLWLAASKTSTVVDQCVATAEPAYLAKHAFQLSQLFNYFYHRHPILSESDEARKTFLLATVAVVRRELIRALAMMGITVPPVM
ncbi:MAG TPA: arginine--tRNA ligase [Terriglobales bacterium]|nr:arginine--tRNA ligase [Terriglobales bacterium]